MRHLLIALSILLCNLTTVQAQVSIGIGVRVPGLSIGINMPAYPQLVPVPGLPVYYDPRANLNYFFYDGLYWVYQGDYWYQSGWYNGPWLRVDPYAVPLFVLRVPMRYYRLPPSYFRGWRADAPPRWGEHWGRDWERHRSGWDRWEPRTAPRAAPLPAYQRQFSGERYPHELEQQQSIRSGSYKYQPHDPFTQQHFEPQRATPDRGRAPQTNPPQRQLAPQEPGRDSRAEAPGKGRDNRAGAPNQGRGKNGEERNQERP